MNFSPYPFELLNNLISNISPKKEIIKLTIGEPQFQTPQIILNELIKNAPLLCKYPPSKGESYLIDSQIEFIKNRFKLDIKSSEILPTFGTREVLFNFPSFFFNSKFHKKSTRFIAFPNPFYKIYEGAAIASDANIIFMNLNEENNFKPHLDEQSLKKVDLVILNSPNNPTGSTLNIDELSSWVKAALEYDFILLSDECYSEIYENIPPPSILEASLKVGNRDFKNILALNSISKKISAPGLRSGFIAGDSRILKDYALYRTYIGAASPLPLQKAASVAWRDKEFSENFRQIYARNLKLSREILKVKVEPYTFYTWLKVADDMEFTKELYANDGILVLPGRFLGQNGAGVGYVRIALVYSEEVIKDSLERLLKWI